MPHLTHVSFLGQHYARNLSQMACFSLHTDLM